MKCNSRAILRNAFLKSTLAILFSFFITSCLEGGDSPSGNDGYGGTPPSTGPTPAPTPNPDPNPAPPPGGGNDPAPFYVEGVDPSNGAVEVATRSPVRLSFSKEVDPSTLIYNSGVGLDNVLLFPSSDSNSPVMVEVSVQGTAITITPLEDYASGEQYTLNILTSLRDIEGQRLDGIFMSSFRAVNTESPSPTNLVTLTITQTGEVPVTQFRAHWGPVSRFSNGGVYENNEVLVTDPMPPMTTFEGAREFRALVMHPFYSGQRYYFAATACNEGACSVYSGEASWVAP